jgi:hypothetical protein
VKGLRKVTIISVEVYGPKISCVRSRSTVHSNKEFGHRLHDIERNERITANYKL